MSAQTPIPLLIAAVAEHDGATPLNQTEGLWIRQLDEQWLLVANPHRQALVFGRGVDGDGVEIAPFCFYVEYNGWPAGVFNSFQGVFAAGSGANEESFAAALEKAAQS